MVTQRKSAKKTRVLAVSELDHPALIACVDEPKFGSEMGGEACGGR
jgi:hypothetical protein